MHAHTVPCGGSASMPQGGELVAPSESTTVTAVALNNGFFHLARFSAYYRKQFGETPGPDAAP